MLGGDYVSIKDLAKCLGMACSHPRRSVMKLGYSFHNWRTPDSGNEWSLCVASAEADEMTLQHQAQGFLASTVFAYQLVGTSTLSSLSPILTRNG